MLCQVQLLWRQCESDDSCRITERRDPGGNGDVLRQTEVSQAAAPAGVYNKKKKKTTLTPRPVWLDPNQVILLSAQRYAHAVVAGQT